MNYRRLLCAASAAMAVALPGMLSAQSEPVDVYADTWVAIDGASRVLPTAATQPLKTDKDRTVAIFYVSWHYDWFHTNFKAPYASDVTKILEKDPSARLDYNNPLWPHEFAYHWGEPEMGYFTAGDPYVIRKDISMLTDAGVDLLVLDFTNAVLYPTEWNALLDEMTKLKAEGHKVPKVCWWGYNGDVAECVRKIHEYYYLGERYKDLWFYWEGKPLLLYNEAATYPQEIKDYFTLRHMWWGYYEQGGKHYVGSEDHWSFGYDLHDPRVSNLTPAERASYHNGRVEQMCVTPAQHASTFVGKSWTIAGGEPALNEYDLPKKKFANRKWIDHPEYYGFYFRDRWEEALSVDPDLLYLNDWNEWIAGQFPTPEGSNFMGRPKNNFHFVDQYNAEFNRTIQPMKGGATDNYYMQMVDGIRRYKGVRPAPVALKASGLTLSSDLNAWSGVGETFYDTHGDTFHRDYTGYGGNKYVDTTGRNDIVVSKVSVTADKVTFYVETADALTPYTDPNWMLLFINSDANFESGWHGFDFMLNKEFADATHSRIMAWNKESNSWKASGEADFRTEGNKLVIEMPLEAVGLKSGDAGNFYFKWADNPADVNDAISLCLHGDTAPNRRFCYNYTWNYDSSALGEDSADAPLRVAQVGKCLLHVNSDAPFTVSDMLGHTVATGATTASVAVPSNGLYVVASGTNALKVIVQ